ncbi:hypothetical protein [Candidatus Methylocalor cossyra]|uniref:Uncharacterized protein n=1 Tax=Candidatus Methylocalor cossyra TaxID=3108543 RepID=A0ABP1CB62_9GAMM
MKLDVVLAKVFKFITFLLFTFMALVYFGVLLVLPLDVLFQVTRIFHGIGLPTVLSAGLGIAVLAYLGYRVSQLPRLYMTVLDIGVQLISFSQGQIKRFDALTEPLASDGGVA